jgi:hypothetical protein
MRMNLSHTNKKGDTFSWTVEVDIDELLNTINPGESFKVFLVDAQAEDKFGNPIQLP